MNPYMYHVPPPPSCFVFQAKHDWTEHWRDIIGRIRGGLLVLYHETRLKVESQKSLPCPVVHCEMLSRIGLVCRS